MKSECGAARRALLDRSAVRRVDESRLSAERHASICPRCRAFVQEGESGADALKSSLSVAAPVALRESLFDAIAAARQPGRRRRRFTYVAAVVAASAASLVVGYSFSARATVDPAIATVVADHALATVDERLESASAEVVGKWLSERVAYAVMVPVLDGARLIGGRTSMTPHGRGAVVEYEIEGRRVSYFILAAPPGAGPDRMVRIAGEKGYSVAHWRDRGLLHVFVAALDAGRVKALAHECIDQMQSIRTAVRPRRGPSFLS